MLPTSSLTFIRRLFVLLGLGLLAVASSVQARELYAAPGASDATEPGDGTRARPFTSLHHAVKQLQPGDTLLLKAGTYKLTEPLRLGPGGREKAWVVIKGAGDGEAIIDGSEWKHTPQVSARLGATGMVHVEGPSYVRFEDLTLKNSLAMGIFVRGPSHHVDIENIRTAHTYSCGIGAWNTHHIRILRNTVTDANNLEMRDMAQPKPREAPHEAISLGGVTDFEIAWNHVHDSHKEGIDVKEASRDGRVHHNIVRRVHRQALYADAWYGMLENVSFDHNYVEDCEWGVVLSCEGEGAWMRKIWVHNNVFVRTRGSGVYFGRWGLDGERREIVIAHNTLVRNGTVNHWAGGTGGIDLRSPVAEAITVANNIVVDSGAFGIGSVQVKDADDNATVKHASVQANLVFPWVAKAAEPTDSTSRYGVSRAFGRQATLVEDPRFMAPAEGDFRLAKNSPARGRAAKLSLKLPYAERSENLGASDEALKFAREAFSTGKK